MKEKSRMLGKRLLSIILSAAAAAGNLPLTMQQNAMVFAADTQSSDTQNIVEALGIDTSKPESFDDIDKTTNPLGKKNKRIAGTDEVLIASSGNQSGFLVGQNSTVGQAYGMNRHDNGLRGFFADHEGWVNENGIFTSHLPEGEGYISEMYLFFGTDYETIKSNARKAGCQLIGQSLNGSNSNMIYIGVKRTTNPKEAITRIIVKEETLEANLIENGTTYHPVVGSIHNPLSYAGCADTNKDNRGKYVYIYTTKEWTLNDDVQNEPRPCIKSVWVDNSSNNSCSNQNLNKDDEPLYLHIAQQEDTIYVKPEGESTPLAADIANNPFLLTRTAAGFFDERKDGKKTQYAMVSYNPEKQAMELGVYEAETVEEENDAGSVTKTAAKAGTSTVRELGWYNPHLPEQTQGHVDSVELPYAATVMNIATGDLNNDGTDEIIVYNPNVNGENGAVEIYIRTHNQNTTCFEFQKSTDALNAEGVKYSSSELAWERVAPIEYALGSVPSLSVGDVNNDGFDDVITSCDGVTQVLFGGLQPFSGNKPVSVETKHAQEEDEKWETLLKDTNAVVYNIPGTAKNGEKTVYPYLAVLGYHDRKHYQRFSEESAEWVDGGGCYVLTMYSYEKVKNKATYDFVKKAEIELGHPYEIGKLVEKDGHGTTEYIPSVQALRYTLSSYYETEETLYFPSDLHVMNGKMCSLWLKETLHIADIAFNGSEITTTTVKNIPEDARLLTRTRAGAYSADEVEGNNSYAFDFQTAVLNAAPKVETTFYQYFHAFGGTFGLDFAVGAYTAGNEASSGAYYPEMSPYAYFHPSENVKMNTMPRMLVVLDTDDDSSNITYTGRHWYQYSDPEILAVLSAPPYFKDLAAVDPDYVGSSSTSFGKSKGSTEGVSESFSMQFGGYVKFTPKIEIFGVEIAGIESEIHSATTFSQNYSKSNTVTMSLDYTTSGEDAVVLYSIPVECYEYTFAQNKNGKQESATGIMMVPQLPSHTMLSLSEYRELCKEYPDMPVINDDVVRHTIGEPSTYPKNEAGYVKPTVHEELMNITSNTENGSMSMSQSISLATEEAYEYSGGMTLSWLAGITSEIGGAGLEGGTSVEAGTVSSSTKELCFSCESGNLPKEAKDKGYSMSSKLFVHESSYVNQNGDVVTFPVVDYLVPISNEPPHVPQNFRQDYDKASTDSVTLTWEYDAKAKDVSFFTVYQMLRSKSEAKPITVEVGTVGFSDFVKSENGKNYYSFTDMGGEDGLLANSSYTYVIQANRNNYSFGNNCSLLTDELEAFTLSEEEYPKITLEGLFDNTIQMYPDITHSVKAVVDGNAAVRQINWQKRNPKTGSFVDLDGYRGKELALNSLIADKINDKNTRTIDAAGEYRCKVTCDLSSGNGTVSVYSEPFTMTVNMRPAKSDSMTTAVNGSTLKASVSVMPDDEKSLSNAKTLKTPTGTVVFRLYRDEELVFSRSASLKSIGSRTASASFEETVTKNMLKSDEELSGIYQLTATYSGDKYFAPFESEAVSVLFGDEQIYPVTYRIDEKTDLKTGKTVETKHMTNIFYVGDTMRVEFHQLKKDENGTITDTFLDTIPVVTKKITETPQTAAYKDTVAVGETTYSYSYVVKPVSISVGVAIPTLYEDALADIKENTPLPVMRQLSGKLLDGDELEELVLLKYINVASQKEKELKGASEGNYKTALKVNSENPSAKNYDFTFVDQTFSIFPSRHTLKLNEPKNGSIDVVTPEPFKGITKETTLQVGLNSIVQLTANPDSGYRFDKWDIDLTKEQIVDGSLTSETIIFTSPNKDLEVSASFVEDFGKVMMDLSPSTLLSGTIVYPDNFVNGAEYPINTKLTFEMKGNEDCEPDYWAVTFENNDIVTCYDTASITIEVTDKLVTLIPIFIGKPCMLTYSPALTAKPVKMNCFEDWKNPIVPSGQTVPKGSKISISPVSEQYASEIWLLNGQEIDLSSGSYELVIDGDTVIERQSERTTTNQTTNSSETTASSASESKTTESSATSKNTESSATSKTTESSATSKTTESSATSKTTESSATSKTTESSATSKTTESSATSKTTESSATSKTTESSATSKTTESSATSKTTESSATSKSTESSATSKTTESSATSKTTESATIPTETTVNAGVTTTGTTVSETKETTSSVTGEAGSTSTATETTTTTETTATKTVGDVNGDGSINLKDVVILRRYIAGGWNVNIDETAADINGDGSINLKDVVILRRFVASGWGIVLRALT